MYKHVTYKPEGVCSEEIEFDLIDGFVHHVKFVGGCAGNTKGVAILSEGQYGQDMIDRLKGVCCQGTNSCPHQFALAIEEALKECEE